MDDLVGNLELLQQAFAEAQDRAVDRRIIEQHRAESLKLAYRNALRRLYKLRMEGVAMFVVLPHLIPFLQCSAKWRMIIAGNRASKTQTCAYEFACVHTGADRYDKYVRTGGNSLVVGRDNDDLSRLWATCAEPCFKKIRDEHTGLWRAVRPDPNDPTRLDPYDEAHREKWQDGPPLIPPRHIRSGVAWEDAGKRVPRVVRFATTGWKSLWRSSKGEPPQGDKYDFGWLDEQLENQAFFSELNRGLVGVNQPGKHSPKGIWSLTPQSTNIQASDLNAAAEAGATYVRVFSTSIYLNCYIPAHERETFIESVPPHERIFRVEGKFPIEAQRIYGLFVPSGVHGCEPFPLPPDYCRWLILDPGTNRAGTMYMAVDPEESHTWITGGFALRQGNAGLWAEQVKRDYDQDGVPFQAAICDSRAGPQDNFGTGITVAERYWQALMDAGVQVVQRGSTRGMGGFFPGKPDITARQESLASWLALRHSGPYAGTPRLQYFRGSLPELESEFRNAHVDPKTGKRSTKLPEDLLTCAEYGAAFDPRYHQPPQPESPSTRTVYDVYLAKLERLRGRS
ncbi:MAG: hypothetical protein ACOY3P_20130 [Planctomycetota bacterium]